MGIDTLYGFFFPYDLSVFFHLKNGRINVKMQSFFNYARTFEDIQYILYLKTKC